MAITDKDIKDRADRGINMLSGGNITNQYSMLFDLQTNITKEDLEDTPNRRERENIIWLDLDDVFESPKNCFSKPEGEKREELKGSLKANGQLVPIIVRPRECIEGYEVKDEGSYEILAGHTRVELLKEIDKETDDKVKVKAISKRLTDLEATLLINQSNLQREEITEMEKARAYKNTYEALKKDKNKNLKQGDKFVENDGSGRTDEACAALYGISKDTFRRTMALACCIKDIQGWYEEKGEFKLNKIPMAHLSKLSQASQEVVYKECHKKQIKITEEMARRFVERERYILENKGKDELSGIRHIMPRDIQEVVGGYITDEYEINEQRKLMEAESQVENIEAEIDKKEEREEKVKPQGGKREKMSSNDLVGKKKYVSPKSELTVTISREFYPQDVIDSNRIKKFTIEALKLYNKKLEREKRKSEKSREVKEAYI